MRFTFRLVAAGVGFGAAAWLVGPTAGSASHAGAATTAAASGVARVIDGDSMRVGRAEVRLYGVDAPEAAQACVANGRRWACGRQAAEALRGLVEGRDVACDERDRDAYGRTVAACRHRGVDVGAWLVANGWAMAYRRHSREYVDEEAAAKANRRGIWRGEFAAPWDWRARERRRPEVRAPDHATAPRVRRAARCDIKGNVSYNGGKRLYHVPGDPDYARTRISTARGERWFCSEAEARAAGWRRAVSR